MKRFYIEIDPTDMMMSLF
ncbi:hypothetical protein CAEBREN_19321 [Caenorhabditis brenneri]|uniref:Uncharacterized protein n=1 Tax=Caenorhabditis brenneri TaxID=135651 RepID=G0MKC9_CAEBE|nr:hypothetical protein CAEBREN_19321 [Caenorhabditis brenneri]